MIILKLLRSVEYMNLVKLQLLFIHTVDVSATAAAFFEMISVCSWMLLQ